MAKFRKKPVVIEAAQWDGTDESWQHIMNMGLTKWKPGEMGAQTFYIETLEGDHLARKGDWIIKGVHGEFYPCKPDIFEKTYEDIVEHSKEELKKLSTKIFWMTRRLAEERYKIEWDEEFRKVANFAFNMGITAEKNKDEIPMVTYYSATLDAVSRKDRPYTESKEEIEEWRSELDKTLNKCKKQDKDLREVISGMLSKNTQED